MQKQHCGHIHLPINVHGPNNLVRPIISGINTSSKYHSSRTYIWILDNDIKHVPPTLPSLVKYTARSLYIIDDLNRMAIVSDTSLLSTIDVHSLYTKVLHDEVILAPESFVSQHPSPVTDTNTILGLLNLTLKSNSFSFNDIHCLQIKEAAMAQKWRPITPTSSWEISRIHLYGLTHPQTQSLYAMSTSYLYCGTGRKIHF